MSKWNRRAALTAALVLCALPAFAEDTAPDVLAQINASAGDLRTGIDTVWVLVAGMLVFWMNAGFALVESGLCRAKNSINILAKNFIVFAAVDGVLLGDRMGLDVRRRQSFMGSARPVLRRRCRQLSGARCRLHVDESVLDGGIRRRLLGDQLDPGTALGEVLLPARVRRHRRDDRFGRRRGAHQVLGVHDLQLPAGGAGLPDHRPLDLGRRSARRQQLPRLRRFDRRPLGRRLGGPRGRPGAGSAPREVRQGRQGQSDPRPQHDVGRARRA